MKLVMDEEVQHLAGKRHVQQPERQRKPLG